MISKESMSCNKDQEQRQEEEEKEKEEEEEEVGARDGGEREGRARGVRRMRRRRSSFNIVFSYLSSA